MCWKNCGLGSSLFLTSNRSIICTVPLLEVLKIMIGQDTRREPCPNNKCLIGSLEARSLKDTYGSDSLVDDMSGQTTQRTQYTAGRDMDFFSLSLVVQYYLTACFACLRRPSFPTQRRGRATHQRTSIGQSQNTADTLQRTPSPQSTVPSCVTLYRHEQDIDSIVDSKSHSWPGLLPITLF